MRRSDPATSSSPIDIGGGFDRVVPLGGRFTAGSEGGVEIRTIRGAGAGDNRRHRDAASADPDGALLGSADELADATLVFLAKRESITTILTVDHADFATYRIEGKRRFRVLPVE